ncbi:MAG: alpha/beta fold hydrolase [Solirubrobacteraceae bacterium]
MRISPRVLAAGAVAVAAVGAGLVERRHLRSLARDQDFLALSAPLGGRPLSITSADGTRLHAQVFGPDGGRTLVLAHGWTEQLSFWGPVIRELEPRGLRMIAYDLRGHGHSAQAAGHDYSLARFGEDLEAVLAGAVEGGGPAIVAGHSLGGMSVAAWAEQHDVPRRISAAALVNTGFGDLVAGNLVFGELARWLDQPRLSRALLGSRTRIPPLSSPLSQAAIRYVAFGPEATAAQVAFYERMLVECSADTRAATGVALSEMDLWHAVARLTVPALVVTGTDDRLTPPAHARRIARELPHLSELVELPRTGHMSPLERPREVAAALLRLADSVPASSPHA